MITSYLLFMNQMYEKLGTSQPSKLQVIHYYIAHLNNYTQQEVSFEAMAQIVLDEQRQKDPNMTFAAAAESINAVMKKRNVQFGFLMAIENDLRAQFNEMAEPLQSIIKEDRSTFGGDEQLALETASLYGTIGVTNFGYLDRKKKGFIKELDELGKSDPNITTTFIDDMLSAVIAAAEARSAHHLDQGASTAKQEDVINLSSDNKEKYYQMVSQTAFNESDPETFFKQFREYHPNGIAIRIQESAIDYESKNAELRLVEQYMSLLDNNAPLSKETIDVISNSVRLNERNDLPDYEGDTVYAAIPQDAVLLADTSQFDEVSLVADLSINGTPHKAYRLWWD